MAREVLHYTIHNQAGKNEDVLVKSEGLQAHLKMRDFAGMGIYGKGYHESLDLTVTKWEHHD
jgi:hypothetical protein